MSASLRIRVATRALALPRGGIYARARITEFSQLVTPPQKQDLNIKTRLDKKNYQTGIKV